MLEYIIYRYVICFQCPATLTMDCALGGPNLNQMTLTGHFNLVLLRPRQQGRRQIMVDQVSFPAFLAYIQSRNDFGLLPRRRILS